jgi:hypothetical protein
VVLRGWELLGDFYVRAHNYFSPTSGAEALIFSCLTARLKPCPDTNLKRHKLSPCFPEICFYTIVTSSAGFAAALSAASGSSRM